MSTLSNTYFEKSKFEFTRFYCSSLSVGYIAMLGYIECSTNMLARGGQVDETIKKDRNWQGMTE